MMINNDNLNNSYFLKQIIINESIDICARAKQY